MTISSDLERETKMKSLIEEALAKVSGNPGAPDVAIQGWGHGDEEPELRVLVRGKPRVLEVSQDFLEDEADSDALRKVATAARELVHGDTRRVQLLHRGVYAMYGVVGP